MSPNRGTLDSSRVSRSRTRPPITTLSWLRTTTTVWAERLEVMTWPVTWSMPATSDSSCSISKRT